MNNECNTMIAENAGRQTAEIALSNAIHSITNLADECHKNRQYCMAYALHWINSYQQDAYKHLTKPLTSTNID